MKQVTLTSAFLLVSAMLGSTLASARVEDCSPVRNVREVKVVKKFTNYAPNKGGINGTPGKSASGLPAGNYYLENYLNGSARFAMGAVPQKDDQNPKGQRTSDMFGGVYRAVGLEKTLAKYLKGRCMKVFAGDRYGKGSNGMSKMDIVTRDARSELTSTINRSGGGGGQMIPIGRAFGMRYGKRAVRLPEDLKPINVSGS